MEKELIKRILKIARQAGDIALGNIDKSRPRFKPDKSVITKTDLAVSRLVRSSIKDILKTNKHLLIDEEDKKNFKLLDQKRLESYEYIWAVDPIDGTRSYANKTQLYGISIGILKRLRPYLGVVYMPSLKELYYSDGKKAYFIDNAFTGKEKKKEIRPLAQKITQKSLFLSSSPTFFRSYNWDFFLCPVLSPSCAIIDFCWSALGRGVGCFTDAFIWDFAASWPVAQAAGLKLRSLKTGKAIDKITAGLFKVEKPWRFAEHYILSSKRNFRIIKNAITPKNK